MEHVFTADLFNTTVEWKTGMRNELQVEMMKTCDREKSPIVELEAHLGEADLTT